MKPSQKKKKKVQFFTFLPAPAPPHPPNKALLYDDSLSFERRNTSERIFQTWTRLTPTNLFAEMALLYFFSGSIFLVLAYRFFGSFTAENLWRFPTAARPWLMRLRNSFTPNPAFLIPAGDLNLEHFEPPGLWSPHHPLHRGDLHKRQLPALRVRRAQSRVLCLYCWFRKHRHGLGRKEGYLLEQNT